MSNKKKRPWWKKSLTMLLIIAALLVLIYHGIRLWVIIPDPEISDISAVEKEITSYQNFTGFEKNRLRRSESGLWEMYLEGQAFERGVAAGKMTKELLNYQEDAFVEQIRNIIPSDFYLRFLRTFIGIFNRNLPKYIPEEYQHEIYGIALSCNRTYDFIGTPYERQLNYHSAHDLGHTMQDYMLVGCTSFAVWDSFTEDSSLLIGRNFDFYVGDKFAENKIIAFYNPDRGYKFATVTWAGMTGVLSGMNEKGLTVTINAAKSTIPSSSAMPISILCREILQYASTIDEAYAIAQNRKTFVSESILIGSGIENRAVIFEKSPDNIAIYQTSTGELICANHYQSETFLHDIRNIQNIANSDSPYRQKRTEELIETHTPLNPHKAALILRNRFGLADRDIGMGNEKAVNQLICHHSVIFAPKQKIMWVSTSPWQIGEYVAYDLNTVFSYPDFSNELKTDSLTIEADLFLNSADYINFIQYKEKTSNIKQTINNKSDLTEEWIQQYIATNPELYYVYNLIGDYYISRKKTDKAISYWELALEKEIPKREEQEKIQRKINKAK